MFRSTDGVCGTRVAVLRAEFLGPIRAAAGAAVVTAAIGSAAYGGRPRGNGMAGRPRGNGLSATSRWIAYRGRRRASLPPELAPGGRR